MPKYKVILECRGAVGDAALTYRSVTAPSAQTAEFHACQTAGEHYPEYSDIHEVRIEVDAP